MNEAATAMSDTEKPSIQFPRAVLAPPTEEERQRMRAEKNYRMVVEYSGKVASYDARFAKMRAFVTSLVNQYTMEGNNPDKHLHSIELRNAVRLMKGKKPWK